jgi:hypothetical protein
MKSKKTKQNKKKEKLEITFNIIIIIIKFTPSLKKIVSNYYAG